MTIEFIYDNDCPNVKEARATLLRAFAEAALPPRWQEWERSDAAAPAYVRGYGSPTILVDGKDVAGAEPAENISCCRLYKNAAGGLQGVPPDRLVVSALRDAGHGSASPVRPTRSGGGWRSSLAALPGIGASLLPAGICPACWPAYAGLLSSLGLGFLTENAWLFPLTLVFLLIAVGSLGFRARRRRGYGPFALGLLASAILLTGKFHFASDPAMYGGIALLVAASVWNGWPRKLTTEGSCPACVPAGAPLEGAGTRQ